MEKQQQPSIKGKLTKKDIFFAWLRWNLTAHVGQSTDRLMGVGFCSAISKTLEKLYPNKEDLSRALKRHLSLFNTQCNWGSIIGGAVIALEEEKSMDDAAVPDEVITGFKTGLMGPVAGIGDTIDWLTISPILTSMFLPAAKEGSVIASLASALLFGLICTPIGFTLFHLGYNKGRSSITTLLKGSRIKKLIDGSSIMGLFMMGALCANFVKAQTSLSITTANEVFEIQKYIDMIFPGLLSLATVMLTYYYLEKRGNKYMNALVGLLVAGVVLGALGILK
ncbi:PTS system mannose/fructose/sorbose family transporter subunit IID [Clostridium polynesiense]|uniref:PTS system mannose/fructose/sorbose family transporter subunit IID n=1 Tax=Clostridium polynesiense TaxID=1325933 RepID=UPI00058F4F95|nr:PTS system mannose/fructose/sorbose family transporter subunit IID [Clostridium polynesiense]